MTDAYLTDAQEVALIEFCEHADRYGPDAFSRPFRLNQRTLDVLERKGYVQTQERPMATVARITDKGRELLASMGD